jgi:predicted amidophosphoribosyltransferase
MTYDRLVCANCAAPVSEGRCPVCRANRERLQQDNFTFLSGLNPMALIALLAILVAAVALLAHQTV